MPIDHVRTSSEYCFWCDAQTQQHLFKQITSVTIGFGAPWFVRPFLNRSSTRGKTGQRQQWSVCTVCSLIWAADETTRQAWLDSSFGHGFGDAALNRALREMFATLRCEGFGSADGQTQELFGRVTSEFARRHSERWAQLKTEQNAETLDALIRLANESSNETELTPSGTELTQEHNSGIGGSLQASMGPADEIQAFDAAESATEHSPSTGPNRQGVSSGWMHQIREIGRLRDDGLLTEDEFQAEKTRILRDKDW